MKLTNERIISGQAQIKTAFHRKISLPVYDESETAHCTEQSHSRQTAARDGGYARGGRPRGLLGAAAVVTGISIIGGR